MKPKNHVPVLFAAVLAALALTGCPKEDSEVITLPSGASQSVIEACELKAAECTGAQVVRMCEYGAASPATTFACAVTESNAINNTNDADACQLINNNKAVTAKAVICETANDTEYGLGTGDTEATWVPADFIEYKTASDEYEITQDFFDDMMLDASPLLFDSTRVEFKNPYFKLNSVSSGDAADLLGLGNGDKIISINGDTLKNTDDVVTAVDDYQNDTTFKLKIYKWPDGLREQDYRVVSSL